MNSTEYNRRLPLGVVAIALVSMFSTCLFASCTMFLYQLTLPLGFSNLMVTGVECEKNGKAFTDFVHREIKLDPVSDPPEVRGYSDYRRWRPEGQSQYGWAYEIYDSELRILVMHALATTSLPYFRFAIENNGQDRVVLSKEDVAFYPGTSLRSSTNDKTVGFYPDELYLGSWDGKNAQEFIVIDKDKVVVCNFGFDCKSKSGVLLLRISSDSTDTAYRIKFLKNTARPQMHAKKL